MTLRPPPAVAPAGPRVKIIRFLLRLLLGAVLLAGLAFAVACLPAVQTWAVRRELARQPQWHATVGSVAVTWGGVALREIRVERAGAVLTVPALSAAFPVSAALTRRRIALGGLAAKGWVLDLSRAHRPATPAREAAAALLRAVLGGGRLPFDLSADGIDLEGEVLAATAPDREPTHFHLAVKGGGLGAGRTGTLAVEGGATWLDAGLQPTDFALHGGLDLAMDTPRTVGRAAWQGEFTARGGPFPEGLAIAADAAATRTPDGETWRLDLSRGDRLLAHLDGRLAAATQRLAGSWKFDLRDSDLAASPAGRRWPSSAVAGDGTFEADAAFERVRVPGHLSVTAAQLGRLAAPLEAVGPVKVEARFDLTRRGRTFRLDRLEVQSGGPQPVVVLRLLQPVAFDPTAPHPAVPDTGGDVLSGEIDEFPLASLPDLAGARFAEGRLSGKFFVRRSAGGLELRAAAPFRATGIVLRRGAATVARGLELAFLPTAEFDADGWRAALGPLRASAGGRAIGTLELTLARPAAPDRPPVLEGSFQADLAALTASAGISGAGALPARAASGTFSLSVGARPAGRATLVVAAPDAAHTVTVGLRAEEGAGGAVAFHAPIVLAAGTERRELAMDGTWSRFGAAGTVDATLTGKDVRLDDLRLLAAPFRPDRRRPFWGGLAGRIGVAFDRLTGGGTTLRDVRGTLRLEPAALRLESGLFTRADGGLGQAAGAIAYDAAAALPYQLAVTLAAREVDAAAIFGRDPQGGDPPFEGKFTVETAFRGAGGDLGGLLARTEERFSLASRGGIVRLLKTDVADAVPEAETPVRDALDSAGALVGRLFGGRRRAAAAGAGVTRLDPRTEAALDAGSAVAEFGYTTLALEAERPAVGPGPLRVTLELTAPEERVTGRAELGGAADLPLGDRPLAADLRLAFRGAAARLLAAAGVLAPPAEPGGYAALERELHFAGTLRRPDVTAWHDLLAAAVRRPAGPGKGEVPGGRSP